MLTSVLGSAKLLIWTIRSKIINWPLIIGNVLVPIAILLPIFFSVGDTQLQAKWTIAMIGSAYWFCWAFVRPKFGLPLAILLFWLITQSAWVWIWIQNRYVTVRIYDQVHLRFYAADSVAKLMILIMPILVISRNRAMMLGAGRVLVAITAMVNIGFVLYESFFETLYCQGYNVCGGIMRNPSMNASLMACFIPIIHRMFSKRTSVAFISYCIFYAIIVKSNSGLAMSTIAAILVFSRSWIVYLLPIPVAIAGYYLLSVKFLSSGLRFQMWAVFMEKFAFYDKYDLPAIADFRHFAAWRDLYNGIHWDNVIPGMGFGTFGIFSHSIQRAANMDTPGFSWWSWMHNCWLEFFFVAGLIGLVLLLATYFQAIIRYVKLGLREEAITMVLFGMYMGSNYPTHLATSCLFGAWLTCAGLIKESEIDSLHG